MFNAAIENYDREYHAVVVGATVDDPIYRKPIMNFWREGDARQFCNFIERHPFSRRVELQLIGLAKNYQDNRHRPVTDVEFRLKDGEIQSMTIKRIRIEDD